MSAADAGPRLILVRHPPVDARGRCYGRLDLAVADAADVAELAARLRAYRATVWTSPAQRCRVVAAAIGPHRVDPRLQELDFGDWEGRRWDDVARPLLDAWAADLLGFTPPGGESGAALVARVEAFHRALPPGLHVVISHGGPLRVLAALACGRRVDLAVAAQAAGSVMECSNRAPGQPPS